MAAAILVRRLSEEGLANVAAVESAGTGRWHIDQPADSRALRVLHEHGYDASSHRARQFDTTWFDRFDLILALDQHNFADLTGMTSQPEHLAKVRLLRSYDPDAAASDLDVPDPYYGDLDGYTNVLELIEKAVPSVIDEIRTSTATEPSR
jgi:protein-tyrosine phosphatase